MHNIGSLMDLAKTATSEAVTRSPYCKTLMPAADQDPSDVRVTDALNAAAEAVRSAEALLVTAGAGMGVDSGLPDFRGPEGFWRAYPPYRRLRLRFEQLANPEAFARDPHLAWGFY